MKLRDIKILGLVVITSLALVAGGCVQKKAVESEPEI